MYSVLFYPINSKKNKQGLVPLNMRITVTGYPRADFSTGKWIDPKNWDKKNRRLKSKDEESVSINKYMISLENKSNKNYDELKDRNGFATAKEVQYSLTAEGKQSPGFMALFNEHIEYCAVRLTGETPTLSLSRFNCIKRVRNYFQKFVSQKYHRNEIELHDLSGDTCRQFEIWLKSTVQEGQTHPTGHNGMCHYIKILKQVMNDAITRGIVSSNPFAAFKPKADKVNMVPLKDYELNSIIDLDLSEFPERIQLVRDIFIFACFTGMSYKDIAEADERIFYTDSEGKKWISGQRFKTNGEYDIPVVDIANDLIEKYRNHPKRNGHIMPIYSNQRMNSYLKEIQVLAGIQQSLHFHLARHTAATMFLNLGMVKDVVKRILGHEKIQTTEGYAKLEKESISNEFTRTHLNEKLNHRFGNKVVHISKRKVS